MSIVSLSQVCSENDKSQWLIVGVSSQKYIMIANEICPNLVKVKWSLNEDEIH